MAKTTTTKASYTVKKDTMEAAANRALKNAIRRNRPFTIDDLKLPENFDRTTLGGFMTRAASKGLITPVGTVPSTRTAAKRRMVRQWAPVNAGKATRA